MSFTTLSSTGMPLNRPRFFLSLSSFEVSMMVWAGIFFGTPMIVYTVSSPQITYMSVGTLAYFFFPVSCSAVIRYFRNAFLPEVLTTRPFSLEYTMSFTGPFTHTNLFTSVLLRNTLVATSGRTFTSAP